MAKLEIHFSDATDDEWEYFYFKQEGMTGLRLPGAYLPEFVEALERPNDSEVFYFWQNRSVLNTKLGSTISISTMQAPLLQLSADQRAKLIAHLRSAYAALIKTYR